MSFKHVSSTEVPRNYQESPHTKDLLERAKNGAPPFPTPNRTRGSISEKLFPVIADESTPLIEHGEEASEPVPSQAAEHPEEPSPLPESAVAPSELAVAAA